MNKIKALALATAMMASSGAAMAGSDTPATGDWAASFSRMMDPAPWMKMMDPAPYAKMMDPNPWMKMMTSWMSGMTAAAASFGSTTDKSGK